MKLSRKDLEALCKKTGQQLPEADLKAARGESKHRNKFTVIDNITFASKLEADHYQMLKLRQRAGEIYNLEVHKPFVIKVNGEVICKYICDFWFQEEATYKVVIHDTKGEDKGCAYDLFLVKKKLMKAVFGYDVIEIRKPKR